MKKLIKFLFIYEISCVVHLCGKIAREEHDSLSNQIKPINFSRTFQDIRNNDFPINNNRSNNNYINNNNIDNIVGIGNSTNEQSEPEDNQNIDSKTNKDDHKGSVEYIENYDHLIQESSICMYRPLISNGCKVSATDEYLNGKIDQMIEKQKITLIEYSFQFPNYSYNPFIFNATFYHKPHIWSRASTTYGQTLLSLAFNYGILSLMTLTFGTSKINVNLTDSPSGCFGNLPEMNKMVVIRELAMRDFLTVSDLDGENKTNHADVQSDSRICHEVVENENGYAKFADCCCYADGFSNQKLCNNSSQNSWLTFLYILLTIVRYFIFLFGPLLFLTNMTSLAENEFPYIVKLNDKLIKTVYFCLAREDIPKNMKSVNILDLSNKHGFSKLKDSLTKSLYKIEEFWKLKNNGSLQNKKNTYDIDVKDNLSKGNNQSDLNNKLDVESNLEEKKNEFKLPKSLYNCPMKIRISEYDILIDYKRLVTENDVSIGFWKTIFYMIFLCGLRNVGPFQECCSEKIFKNSSCFKNRSIGSKDWLSFWKIIGSILLVICIPIPYYIRLWILYQFEIEEILSRKTLISTLGLKESFENSLLHYFLPDHILFVCIYVVYACLAISIVLTPEHSENKQEKQVAVNSFTDLKNLSWVEVLHMLVSNVIWPFKKFGIFGFLVVLVYWPIIIPLSLFVFCVYCLPTLFLTTRMLYHSKKIFSEKRIKSSRKIYKTNKKTDNNLTIFYAENIFEKCFDRNSNKKQECNNNENSVKDRNEYERTKLTQKIHSKSDLRDIDEIDNLNQSRMKKQREERISTTSSIIKTNDNNKRGLFLKQMLVSIVCVVVFYSVLIIVTECLGSLVDMLVFTMMGIIVNAGSLLKYIALIIMVVVYSFDSFNNVEKKYLKLNKALFSEVKSRIKDLDKVTSLPSHLQENRGFKSQELNEQAEYEKPDNLADEYPCHWFINDLVLFVDDEDMPRIPKNLFEQVCEIKVAGVPGPVYSELLLAMKQFLKIVVFIVFVFIVVLTFGAAYEVSSTNQMLAALAGGSLPFILRTFMEPEKPEIEMGTVSFKSKLDEVIKNFCQYWPMYDFDFELYEPEEEEDDSDDEKNERKKKEKKKLKKLKKKSESKYERKLSVPYLPLSDNSRNFPTFYSSENISTVYEIDQPRTHEPKLFDQKAVIPSKSDRSAKVCFTEPLEENCNKVDIIVLIPEDFDVIHREPNSIVADTGT